MWRALFNNDLVLTSSELNSRVSKALKINEVAARQKVCRAVGKSEIWCSVLKLANRSRLYALKESVGKSLFIENVHRILNDERPGVARCIRALKTQKSISKQHAHKLLSVSVNSHNKRRHPTYEEEITSLEDLMCCYVVQKDTPIESLVFKDTDFNNWEEFCQNNYSLQQLERIIANFLMDNFRNQNFVSWGGAKIFSNKQPYVEYCGYPFSSLGFSYLRPFVESINSQYKPTPVLLDVFPKNCTEDDVESFLSREKRGRQNSKAKRITLGIIAAYTFDESAFQLAKNNGLMTINLKQQLGAEAIETIKQIGGLLEKINTQDYSTVLTDLPSLGEMIKDLKTNPFVVELRSVGFEILCALIINEDGYYDVTLGKDVPFGDTTRDVDVYGKKNGGDDFFIIECKAYSKNKELTADEVTKFFTETVPFAIKELFGNSPPKRCSAEIWTSGKIGVDASDALEEVKVKKYIKKYIRDGAEIKRKLPRNLKRCGDFLSVLSADIESGG